MTVPRSSPAASAAVPLPSVIASEDVTVIEVADGDGGSGTSGTSTRENPTAAVDDVLDIAEGLPSVYLKGCAEEHSMPSLVGIGCRADGVSSRLSHHLDDGAVPAEVLKSRKRFMQQYELVVKKIQALQAIKTKNKVNASFTPARLKEAKKTEKQMRKLRSSILRKDLPLLRKAANGSSHMCSFSRPMCREDMEKHIDMIVELQAWIEEDVVLDLGYENDDAIAVDVTVDTSRAEEEEATEYAAAAAAAASGAAAAAVSNEAAAELDASLNDSISRTPREPKIYARRVAAQKERKEAVQRREELRAAKQGHGHGQGGDSGSSWASSCAPQPAASTDGDIGGEEEGGDEGELEASTASVGSGSAQGGSPSVGEGPSSAPGSPEGRAAPEEGVQENHEENEEVEEAPTDEERQGEEAQEAPVVEEGPAGGAEQGPSEASQEVLRQQIDDTVALEAAQRAEALQEAKRESQRLRSELKKKQQAMQSRQSARWDKGEGGGETPRCVRKLQEFNDDPQSFVDMIYAEYPPRDGKQKYDRGNLKKTVQRAISHYHPDKQDEVAHGGDWLVICDEICKELTRIYVKL